MMPPPAPVRRAALVIGLCGLLATSCRTAPDPVMLTLPLPATAGTPEPLPPGMTAPPVLQIRRVALPEHLLDRHVRYRLGAGTVVNWPDATWADRLDVSITEHLAMRLRAALPGWTVCVRHCPLQPQTLTLRVEFAPFDLLQPQGELVADVQWWLDRSAPGGVLTHAGQLKHREPVSPPTAATQAVAIGRLLDLLAAQIASLSRSRLLSEHKQRQQDDDGQRNAQKPQEDGSHDVVLSIKR